MMWREIAWVHGKDGVVVLFFPNDQNLRGLTDLVGDIRSEADEPRNKSIELHFVMSNVPDLDDEDRMLESKINAFQDQLGFRREPMAIHRYDSLSLLNQVVFARDRPKSGLAMEYGEIVREISSRNWQDRDGALEYLRRAGRRWRWTADDSTTAGEECSKELRMSMRDAFNFGMAMWGENGTVETEAFRQVIELDRLGAHNDGSANCLQCMANDCWASGVDAAAMDYVDRAGATLRALRGRTESGCWRNLQVTARIFEADLADFRALIENGSSPMPLFMAVTTTLSAESQQDD